jgi:hypothetical protein
MNVFKKSRKNIASTIVGAYFIFGILPSKASELPLKSNEVTITSVSEAQMIPILLMETENAISVFDSTKIIGEQELVNFEKIEEVLIVKPLTNFMDIEKVEELLIVQPIPNSMNVIEEIKRTSLPDSQIVTLLYGNAPGKKSLNVRPIFESSESTTALADTEAQTQHQTLKIAYVPTGGILNRIVTGVAGLFWQNQQPLPQPLLESESSKNQLAKNELKESENELGTQTSTPSKTFNNLKSMTGIWFYWNRQMIVPKPVLMFDEDKLENNFAERTQYLTNEMSLETLEKMGVDQTQTPSEDKNFKTNFKQKSKRKTTECLEEMSEERLNRITTAKNRPTFERESARIQKKEEEMARKAKGRLRTIPIPTASPLEYPRVMIIQPSEEELKSVIREWGALIREQFGNKCFFTGVSSDLIEVRYPNGTVVRDTNGKIRTRRLANAHHIYGQHIYITLKTDIRNGILISEKLHLEYHQKYDTIGINWHTFCEFIGKHDKLEISSKLEEFKRLCPEILPEPNRYFAVFDVANKNDLQPVRIKDCFSVRPYPSKKSISSLDLNPTLKPTLKPKNFPKESNFEELRK